MTEYPLEGTIMAALETHTGWHLDQHSTDWRDDQPSGSIRKNIRTVKGAEHGFNV